MAKNKLYPPAVVRVNEGPLVIDKDRLVPLMGEEEKPHGITVNLDGDNFHGKSFTLDHRYDWTLVKSSHGSVVLVPLFMKKAKFEDVDYGISSEQPPGPPASPKPKKEVVA